MKKLKIIGGIMIPKQSRSIRLEDWQILTLRGGAIAIHCITGAIWVTWPKGEERVLQQGQQLKIKVAGKVCVQALTGSQVAVQ